MSIGNVEDINKLIGEINTGVNKMKLSTDCIGTINAESCKKEHEEFEKSNLPKPCTDKSDNLAAQYRASSSATETKLFNKIDEFNEQRKKLNCKQGSPGLIQELNKLNRIFKEVKEFYDKHLLDIERFNNDIKNNNNITTNCRLKTYTFDCSKVEGFQAHLNNLKETTLGFGKSGRKRSGRKGSKKSKGRKSGRKSRKSKKSSRKRSGRKASKGRRGSKRSGKKHYTYYCKARLGRRSCGSKIMGRSRKFCKKHMGSKIASRMYARSRKRRAQRGW